MLSIPCAQVLMLEKALRYGASTLIRIAGFSQDNRVACSGELRTSLIDCFTSYMCRNAIAIYEPAITYNTRASFLHLSLVEYTDIICVAPALSSGKNSRDLHPRLGGRLRFMS